VAKAKNFTTENTESTEEEGFLWPEGLSYRLEMTVFFCGRVGEEMSRLEAGATNRVVAGGKAKSFEARLDAQGESCR
jgi:hypothetical protein